MNRGHVEAQMRAKGYVTKEGELDWTRLCAELGVADRTMKNFRGGVVPGTIVRRAIARTLATTEAQIWPQCAAQAGGSLGEQE